MTPLPALRHRRILDLLAERDYLTVTEARVATGVSASTTHRDLAALAEAGALTRIRGGAARRDHDQGHPAAVRGVSPEAYRAAFRSS